MDTERRWELCDPLVPGYLNTSCWSNASKCKAEYANASTQKWPSGTHSNFTNTKQNTVLDVCINSRDYVRWPPSGVDACCPSMALLGHCARTKCDADNKQAIDLVSPVDGYQLDFPEYLSLGGLLCKCNEACQNLTYVVSHFIRYAQSDSVFLSIISKMNMMGMSHELMPWVCSKGGWNCLATSKSCQDLAKYEDLRAGVMAVQGIANAKCPKPPKPPKPPSATTTTTACNPCDDVKTSPGSLLILMPSGNSFLTANFLTMAGVFKKALAKSIAGVDESAIIIKAVYIDGVKVSRRLGDMAVPRRLADASVQVFYELKTNSVIDTSTLNKSTLTGHIAAEAKAVGQDVVITTISTAKVPAPEDKVPSTRAPSLDASSGVPVLRTCGVLLGLLLRFFLRAL